ncbi:MAG TPA: translation initiation factor [Planctomycetia bacterium]|jgi:translation initiation factor 1|nr:translation initiation factor [Planctomycetia bacterium]
MARLFEGTVFDRPLRCETCGELDAECKCPPPVPNRTPPEKQTLRLAIEKRGKGKKMTVVRGVAPDNDLPALLATLKNACGAGGTIEEGELLVQGEQQPRLRETLARLGYKVKG